ISVFVVSCEVQAQIRCIFFDGYGESSDEESLTSEGEDEEYAMVVRDCKKLFNRRDPNRLIKECLKPPKDKKQRAFVGGSWSNSSEEDDEKAKDETCLVAQASSESLTTMAYSSSSPSEVKLSSSLDSYLAFKTRYFLSPLALTISKSFLMIRRL
nr:hypothetical protein [Tanacetum cinerariifolium]